MTKPSDRAELDAFLRSEVAGVDLERISLESVPVVRWRSVIQSRLRAIAGYQDGTTVLSLASAWLSLDHHWVQSADW
jgi:hypothetical protein